MRSVMSLQLLGAVAIIVGLPSLCSAQASERAGADTAAAATYPVVARAQRPTISVVPFEFAATLSDEDRAELNSTAGLFAAMRGQDPGAAANQSNQNLGKALAAQMMERLMATQNYRVVERAALASIQQEQNLVAQQTQASTRNAGAAQAQRLTGAKYMVTGTITKFGRAKKKRGGFGAVLGAVSQAAVGVGVGSAQTDYVMGVNARLVDTSTGEVLASWSSDATVTGDKQRFLAGIGGPAGVAVGSSTTGEREKKIAEVVAIVSENLIKRLIDLRVQG